MDGGGDGPRLGIEVPMVKTSDHGSVDVPADGLLTLRPDTFADQSLWPLLRDFNQGLPLVIQCKPNQPVGEPTVVQGVCTFLGSPDLPVTGTFGEDSDGPTMSLRFDLSVGSRPGPAWQFSESFTDLPDLVELNRPAPAGHFLDRLSLAEPAFVLSNRAGVDEATGVSTVAGLTFVSKVGPLGVLGPFEALAGGQTGLVLHGPIVPPRGTVVPPLEPDQEPWQVAAPGIRLEVDLGAGPTIGDVHVRDVALRIYVPTSRAWLKSNPTFEPRLAMTAAIVLEPAGSANGEPGALVFELDASAVLIPGWDQVLLTGAFENVSVGSLEQLAGIAPGTAVSALPAELQTVANELSSLSLLAAGIAFGATTDGADVAYTYVTVGFPEQTQWRPLDGASISGLAVDLVVSAPFTDDRQLEAIVRGSLGLGAATFDFSTQVPDFTVRADLRDECTLPLNSFLRDHAPELPALPDLEVDAMELYVAPGSSYSFSASIAETSPWTFELGPPGLVIGLSCLELEVDKEAGAAATGLFSGVLQIGTFELPASYSLPGGLVVEADLPELKLTELIGLFDEAHVALPQDFDLVLEQSSVTITESGDDIAFTAATTVKGVGRLAFTAAREDGKTGVAIGIELVDSSLSALPGLEGLAAIESAVGLEQLVIVLSSLEESGLQFPGIRIAQPSGAAAAGVALPANAGNVARGLTVYAQVDTSKCPPLEAIAKYVGVATEGSIAAQLKVSLPEPTRESSLFVEFEHDIDQVTHLSGQLGFQLVNGDPGAFLTAQLTTTIEGASVTGDVGAKVMPEGFLIFGELDGTVHFGSFQLSNLVLLLGMSFVDELPSFGFAATVDTTAFESSIALFIDTADPTQSMFAGSISSVTLAEVARVLCGQSALPEELSAVLEKVALKAARSFSVPASLGDALDKHRLEEIAAGFAVQGETIPTSSEQVLLIANEPGQAWHLTSLANWKHYALTLSNGTIDVAIDPQLYFAAQAGTLGDLRYPQEMWVSAEVELLFVDGVVEIDLEPSQGMSVDCEVQPIRLGGVLAITDLSDPQKGPQLRLCTFARPNQPKPFDQPHFRVSGCVRLLGVALTGIEVSITETGLAFELKEQQGLVRWDLSGSAGSGPELSLEGTVGVYLDVAGNPIDLGPLGKLTLPFTVPFLDIAGTLHVALAGDDASASLSGTFDILDHDFAFTAFALDVSTEPLGRIESIVVSAVRGAIDSAFRTGLAGAATWLSLVRSEYVSGIQGVEHAAQVLKEELGKTADEAARLLKEAEYDVDEVVSALSSVYDCVQDEIGTILTDVGYEAETVENAVASFFESLAGSG